MELEKIIELAKILARPYKITTIILAILLVLSIGVNIYVLTQPVTVEINANQNTSSLVSQSNGK